MKSRLLGAIVFFAMSGSTNADIVSFSFVAEVTGVSNSSLFLCPDNPLAPCRAGSQGMTIGDRFSGGFTYDTSTFGAVSTPGTQYQLLGAPNETHFDIGAGMQFDQLTALVRNNTPELFVDKFHLSAGNLTYLPAFEFEFGSFDGSLLTTEDLIVDANVFNAFDQRQGTIWVRNPAASQIAETLHFNITVTAVPIPPALYLFGSGLIGLVGMARRKAAL